MSQRTALILAAALTAFVLVAGGAAAGWAAGQKGAPLQAAQAASSDPTAQEQAAAARNYDLKAALAQADTSAQPVSIQDMLDREAALQDLVRQANARLKQAYAENAALTAPQLAPDQAAAIALQLVPASHLIEAPHLVNFQGVPAYEIELDLGNVYVDANSGSLLFSSAQVAPVILPPPSSSFLGSGGGPGKSASLNGSHSEHTGSGGGAEQPGGGEHSDDDHGGEHEGEHESEH